MKKLARIARYKNFYENCSNFTCPICNQAFGVVPDVRYAMPRKYLMCQDCNARFLMLPVDINQAIYDMYMNE